MVSGSRTKAALNDMMSITDGNLRSSDGGRPGVLGVHVPVLETEDAAVAVEDERVPCFRELETNVFNRYPP